MCVIGNVALQCRNEILGKHVTLVIKIKDSTGNWEEHLHHKHREKWGLMGTEARNEFSSSTPSMINFEAGINHYRNRIKKIVESNAAVVCLRCGVNEDWEHVILCKKNK